MLSLPYPVDCSVKPQVKAFHDPQSGTVSYVVKDPASPDCAIIDPVMDFDFAAGRISFHSADIIVDYVRAAGLAVEWLIETHAHADHLSASPYIKDKLGGKIGIGDNIRIVQEVFGKIFNEGTEFQRDGSQFDRLFPRRRYLSDRDHDGFCHGNARPYARLHDPCHRRRCLRRRYSVHAGRRYRAGGFPRRRRRTGFIARSARS